MTGILNVGGLVGYNARSGVINPTSTASGIVNGYANGSSTEKTDVDVNVGGLVGYNDGTLDGFITEVKVVSTGKNAGGLVGYNN